MLRYPLLVILLLTGLLATAAQPRSSKSVKHERQQTEKEIADTRRQINANSANTKKKLAELEGIKAGITRQENEIAELNLRLDSLQTAIRAAGDSVAAMQTRVDSMRAELKNTLRNMRDRRKAVNNISFIFCAPSFSAALKRLEYLNNINEWRAHKIGQLRGQMKQFDERRHTLEHMHARETSLRSQLDATRRTLDQQRVRQQQSIQRLKAESKELNRLLTAKQKKMRELDRELDRIIAAEQKRREEEERRKAAQKNNNQAGTGKDKKTTPAKPTKPASGQQGTAEADRKLSGSFVSNKGKLLFPVSGKYTIVGNFGRTAHRDISNVQVNNSGIDIAVGAGTPVRAVFDGTVSSVFFIPGYNNIVIIRHGQYLTVYAGLTGLTVKKGDAVRTGATIGKVATDEGENVLHFEVRKEKEKLNPLDWVR